jgi:hypothetical protein
MNRVEITKRTLSRRTGSEGPQHDPYSFTEWTVDTNLSTVTLHSGLAQWVEVNGDRWSHSSFNSWGEHYEEGIKMLEETFELETGIPVSKLEKYYDRIHHPKHCCAKPQLEWKRGYPGEHLLICSNCGELLDSEFYLSEVE